MCVTDIYLPLINPRATDREVVWIGRILMILFLTLGVLAAPLIRTQFGSVFEAFQKFLSFFQGPLLSLLLLGMLSSRVTQWGGLAGLLIGILAAVALWWFGWIMLWVAWWSFVASLIGTIVVSLFTRPYDQERLRGLVCWLPPKESTL